MKRKLILLTSVAIILLSVSCKNRQNAGGQSTKDDEMNSAVTERSEAAAVNLSPGKKIYDEYCMACHQEDGSGVPGMYPPLGKAEYVTGPADELIKVIVFGLEGPITVNGVAYSQEMPAHDYLSDDDIATLVNYIKETWGNKGSSVSAADVKRVRESGNN